MNRRFRGPFRSVLLAACFLLIQPTFGQAQNSATNHRTRLSADQVEIYRSFVHDNFAPRYRNHKRYVLDTTDSTLSLQPSPSSDPKSGSCTEGLNLVPDETPYELPRSIVRGMGISLISESKLEDQLRREEDEDNPKRPSVFLRVSTILFDKDKHFAAFTYMYRWDGGVEYSTAVYEFKDGAWQISSRTAGCGRAIS